MIPHQQILERSTNCVIIALSETEIGKVILPSPYIWVESHTGKPVDFFNEKPSINKEITALKFANTLNDLMPKFIRKQTWKDDEEDKEYDMMVMERLYVLPIHHFDVETRTSMMETFEEKMKELHDGLFVHGDFMRPTNYYTRGNLEWMFQNIVQTSRGLRLIDAGFGTICKKANIKEFVSILMRERDEIGYFKKYYLS